jgi:hypothetical protein
LGLASGPAFAHGWGAFCSGGPMTLIFYAGIGLALVGLTGIGWFIQRVRRLKRSGADDATIQAELRFLVPLNVAAVGLAFLGMAIALVGLILA